jgi:hypothetical protein
VRIRGKLAEEARRIAAEHKVSLRQAYRYAAAGRQPTDDVRIGLDGRRYHVRLREVPLDPVDARRVRYTVAMVAKRACLHGIAEADLAELQAAAQLIAEVAASWKACLAKSRGEAGAVVAAGV